MKTTGILISAALLALATTSFGQLGTIKERLFPKKTEQVQYHQVDFTSPSSRVENWISDLPIHLNQAHSGHYGSNVDRTIFTRQVEVIYETDIGLESWMAAPFEAEMAEESMYLESWMTTPFESQVEEETLSLEEWMITALW